MGLAGVKSRHKLSKDPNNTRWSRNEDTFGQKILRSHGWQPGQYLGVQDSAHSAHHTAANSSHIRVTFRDDNAGIGLKMGAGDQATGMGAFQDLLGRLNGKSVEKIQVEKKVREDYTANLYVERKYGGMRFVRGGLLVGDEIKPLAKSVQEDTVTDLQQTPPGTDLQTNRTAEDHSKKEKKDKKEKKSKKRKARDDTPEADLDGPRKKKKKKVKIAEAPITDLTSSADAATEEASKKESKKSKEEWSSDKAGKKEIRRKQKREKRANEYADGNPIHDVKKGKKEKKKKKKSRKDKSSKESSAETEESTVQTSLPSTMEASSFGTSTPRHQPVGARRLHRSKFIASKRAAMMDQTALNQIFMIRSAAGA